MKSPQFFSVCFLLFFMVTANAQDHTDCETAMVLEDQNAVVIETTSGIGIAEDFASICLGQEFASTWFSWEIDQPGKLTFVLTPLNLTDDLDFAVFKLNPNGDCAEKVLERCMAAGENVGDPTGSIPCMGATGLNLTETDVEEQPGCTNGNNNFLAALTCNQGDHFALVVNNFSQTNQGFTLGWGGTATFFTTTEADEKLELGISIAPNPTSGVLNISTEQQTLNGQFRVIDSLGRSIFVGAMTGEITQLDFSNLVAGMYVLVLETGGGRQVHKVMVE